MTVGSIKQQFKRFHKENPEVLDLFCRFANEAYAAGLTEISSKLIIERIRWEVSINTRGSAFKVNNNFTPFYARIYMRLYPNRAKFRTRRLRS